MTTPNNLRRQARRQMVLRCRELELADLQSSRLARGVLIDLLMAKKSAPTPRRRSAAPQRSSLATWLMELIHPFPKLA